MRSKLIAVLFLLITFHLHGQENHAQEQDHHHFKNVRIAGFIGHTLIKSEGSDNHIFIPSWGFDLDYWFSNHWGIGLHNDIEIESFIYIRPNGEEIERVNPLVLTLDGLYQIHNGLVFSAGPGVELADRESFYLIRVGIEWEKDIGHHVDISPAIFYDHRFDGFSTYTVALGVGKRF